jgi:hypothetical protein
MRRFLFVCLLLALVAVPCSAIQGTPFAEASLAVSAASISITANLCRWPQTAAGRETPALVEVKNNPIWYTFVDPAGTPTSADHVGYVGTIIEVGIPSQFRAIRQAGDAVIKVTCFRP